MFWDYFANHEAKGGLKMSRNKNYATELGRAINNGGIEDLDFFYRWVDEMDPEKCTAIRCRRIASSIRNY